MGLTKNIKHLKGFSLLEVLVAITVFAFIVTATSGVFVSLQHAWRRQRAMVALLQNGRWATERMAYEIMEGGNVSDNPGGIAVGRGARFRPYPGPPTSFACYWRGDAASDAVAQGDSSFLYRGDGNNINQAYLNRQQLANFVVDNPDLVDNATGLPPPDGSIDPVFINNAGLLTIELTFRPIPTQPAGRENRNFTLRTQVRVRN